MTPTTDIGLVITYLNNIWKTNKNKKIGKHMKIMKFWKTRKTVYYIKYFENTILVPELMLKLNPITQKHWDKL